MSVSRLRSSFVAAFVTVFLVLAGPSTAHADPAGPTDYRTEVVDITPPVDGVTIDIIGGDSFVQLTVEPGVDVAVAGYSGEPYLWFQADGTVLENRNSPTTYQNEERYGADAPAFADANAEPDWAAVASNGRYAWHDHRAHWMQPIRPAGLSPGDQILEQVIPLTVDGTPVRVTVISTWLAEPSLVPAVLGAIAGAITVTVVGWRRRAWVGYAAMLPVALGAVIVGWWQFRSLPAETGPRAVWPALATIALVAVIAAAVLRRGNRFASDAAALIAGVNLAAWAVVKRDGITAAIIPTDAPQWLDRGAVAGAFVAGVGVTVFVVRELFLVAPGTSSDQPTT